MKKKKKTLKKKKNNLWKIIVLVVLLGIISFVVINNLTKTEYMNNAAGKCRKGEYMKRNFFSSGCSKCEGGYYCPGDNKRYTCPDGRTTHGQYNKSISDCKYCKDDSKYFDGKKCVSCPIGYYCSNGQKNACPYGTTTKGTGAKKSSECIKANCKKNEYVNNGVCTICPKNYYCDGNKKTSCSHGRITTSTGQTSGSACICPNGTYSDSSNVFCITCEKGKYCVNGKMYACNVGTYQDKTGKSSCTTCPNGKSTKTTGAKSSNECNVTKCQSGTYSSNGTCKSCPKCNGSTKCFTSPAGATSVNKCYGTVPAGKYITCTSSGCTVKECTGNTYSTAKTVNYSSSLKTSCTSCGTKKVNSTHTGCVSNDVSCPIGQYKSNGKCYSCPKCNGGTTCFNASSGATSVSQCFGTVPAGKYITCTSSGCTVKECTGNTYSTKKSVQFSSSLKTSCTSCGTKKANSTHTGCI